MAQLVLAADIIDAERGQQAPAADILVNARRGQRPTVVRVQNRYALRFLSATAMLTALLAKAASAVVENVRATIIREKQSATSP